jgi:hypothetical protein
MRRFCLLLGVVLMCGCGKGKVRQTEDKPEAPRLLATAELLKKSRAELATLEKECADKIALEWKDFDDDAGAKLLSALRFPLVTPVWQDATYSEQAQLSLPGYLKPGTKDSALAWHLARHGDLEAARRLADPGEVKTLADLHRSLYERNYPLEWARLVARQIQLAQLRLRHGEAEAATDMLSLHREIRQVLDAKARTSPLGSALLGLGRRSLRETLPTWRAAQAGERVKQVEEALAAWGDVPAPSPGLLPGMSRALLERLWGCKSDGPVLAARDVARALDTAALPLPSSNVEAVLACFDSGNKVREVVILYRPKLSLSLPSPADLAHHLEESSLPVTHEEEKAGLRRAVYSLDKQRLEVVLCVTNGHLGGVVRLRADSGTGKVAALERDFGPVHLDASFEQNRLRSAPQQLGDSVTASDSKVLGAFRLPLGRFHPVEAVLSRDKGATATRRLLLRCDAETSPVQLLNSALVGARGFGTIVGEDSKDGRHIAFVWEDGRTRYGLRLPNAGQQPSEFEAVTLDPRPSQGSGTSARDPLRRKRLAAKKPWKVLPRSLLVERVALGMTRAEVEKALPRAEKHSFGMRQTFTARQFNTPSFVPRQLIVRFAGDRAAEIRLLLLEATRGDTQPLFASVQEKYGATEPLPARWSRAWRDLVEQAETASLSYWQDDLTLMTYERLGGIAEWVLRDRPPEQEGGIALERVGFCPRGVEGCRLGDSRADILRGWKGTTAKDTGAEALTLFPPSGGPHDTVLVWFKDDKAVRIVARHALPKDGTFTRGEMPKALNEAWGAILPTVGWWSQSGSRDGALTFLGWLDEHTRMRLFWNDDDGSPRVFSEWVDVPPSGPLPALP